MTGTAGAASTAGAVMLFTRDLRVRDNPALAAAARAGPVLPLFVIDPRIRKPANRRRFLAECLADLRESLRHRGADLVVRTGDPVTVAVALARQVGAGGIHLAEDVSGFAHRRAARLATAAAEERLALHFHPGVTVVPPGALRPSGGDGHYRVFTPYWRVWEGLPRRAPAPTPRRLTLPGDVTGGDPAALLGPTRPDSADLPPGGESAGAGRLRQWLRHSDDYPARQDDLAGDRTSRLSAYLHFGCLSPLTVAAAAAALPALVRQLCWRDFYHQLLAAFPDLPRRSYRPRQPGPWREDPAALAAWQAGQTGLPIVDAGMRQLAHEGWLPNRARLITAAYLTRQLGLGWPAGAAWYDARLVDADVANNYGNWQWVAGTGTDTRPNRRYNLLRQAHRFDPEGRYVRRWVPELAGVDGAAVHEPWRLPPERRRGLRYPPLNGPARGGR